MKVPIKRKHTHITLGVILFITLILIVGNYWVRRNIESIIQNLVANESGGKYRLEVKKIKFHGRQQRLEAYNAHLFIIDTAIQKSGTDVQFPYLEFRLKSVWDVIFHKKLVLNSVICSSPTFNIRPVMKDSTSRISIPEQLGELYIQIDKVMHNMQVTKLRFTKSNFNLFLPRDSTKVIRLHDIDFGVDGFDVHVGDNKSNNVFFSENIFVRSGPQSFVFPDGLHGLDFSSLSISTDKKLISINNCTLTGKSPDSVSAKYRIHFDTLHLVNTDFKAIYVNSLIKVDTVYCKNSNIDFLFNTHKKNKKLSADTLINTVVKSLFGDILVNYIGIINSDISVKTQRDDKTFNFTSIGNNFRLREINIGAKNKIPVQVKSIDFDVKNYHSFTDDSLYEISFDSVSLTSDQLKLVNFGLTPASLNNNNALRAVNIPSLTLKGLSLGDLIFDKTIKVDEAQLKDPAIIIEGKGADENKIRKPLFDIFNDLEKYIGIEKLTIQNGNVQYRFSTGENHALNFQNVDASVFLTNLFSATHVSAVETSIDRLSFSKALYNNGLQNILISSGILDGNQKNFSIASLDYSDKNELMQFHASGLLLSGVNFIDSADDENINLEQLTWANGKVTSNPIAENVLPEKAILPVSIFVKNISLPNTGLQLNLPGRMQINTFLHHLDIENFSKPNDAALHFQKAFFDGGSFTLSAPGISVSTDTFNINNLNTSFIENIVLRYLSSKDSVLIKIPKLSGNPGLTNFSTIKSWDGFRLLNPDIQWFHQKDSTKKFATKELYTTPIILKNTSIESAKLRFQNYDRLDTMYANASDIFLQLKYASFNDTTDLRGLNLSLNGMKFISPKNVSMEAQQAKLFWKIDSLQFLPGSIFNIQNKLLQLSSPAISFSGKNKMVLTQVNLEIPEMKLSDKNVDSWKDILLKQTDTKFKFSTNFDDKNGQYLLHGIQFTAKDSKLQLDSMAYIHSLSSDSFFLNQKWQVDYQQFHTGKIILNKVNTSLLLSKPFALHAQSITINDAIVKIIKDKALKIQPHIEKPLPVNALQKLNFHLRIDSLSFGHSTVDYTELPNKKNPGLHLDFSDLNGLLLNVTNDSKKIQDSVYISGKGKINHIIDAKVLMNQSYADSGNFRFDAQVYSFEAPLINPYLQSMAGIRFTRGTFDSIHVNALANKATANGQIQLKTHGLGIEAYHAESGAKTPLLKRFKYFIGNTFILKKEKTRTSNFEAKRVEEKSVFNYWIQIMISAVKSLAGKSK